MAQFIPCVYCLEIPALDKVRRGKLERCPLCKTEILVTSSQASYRMRTSDGEKIHAQAAGVNWFWVLFPVGSSALLALASFFLQRSAPEAPPALAFIPQIQLSEETVTPEMLPYPMEWTPHATAKGGGQHPALVAKNAPQIVAGTTKPFRQPPAPRPVLSQAFEEPPSAVTLFVAHMPDIRAWSATVPEVSLEQTKKFGTDLKDAEANIGKLAKNIAEQNKEKPDGFIHQLKARRADLAGLPFQLSPGCQLEADQAQILQRSSLLVRTLLEQSRKDRSNTFESGILYLESQSLQSANSSGRFASRAQMLPALVQILQAEDDGYRHGLMRILQGIEGQQAAGHLARLALFDPEPVIRKSAVESLWHRPKAEYAKVLLEGLRYPWSPVVQRAAETIVLLKCDNLVPQMIDLLDGPEPSAPFTRVENGRKYSLVREVVKINHHRNCLLCHAPSDSRSELVRAPVPNPYRELPTSSRIYYQETQGAILVRADVTYLRQDFSLCLEVDNAHPWPKTQRFDFLVRERPATVKDHTPVGPTAYHQTVLQVLREITGISAGLDAVSWRMAFPIEPDRIWKSACNK